MTVTFFLSRGISRSRVPRTRDYYIINLYFNNLNAVNAYPQLIKIVLLIRAN